MEVRLPKTITKDNDVYDLYMYYGLKLGLEPYENKVWDWWIRYVKFNEKYNGFDTLFEVKGEDYEELENRVFEYIRKQKDFKY